MSCIFCELASDRFIDETELTLVLRDAFPVTDLHTLIIPKRHVSDYFNLTIAERDDIQNLLLQLKLYTIAALKKVFLSNLRWVML